MRAFQVQDTEIGGGAAGDDAVAFKREFLSIQLLTRQIRYGASNDKEDATASMAQPPEALWACPMHPSMLTPNSASSWVEAISVNCDAGTLSDAKAMAFAVVSSGIAQT